MTSIIISTRRFVALGGIIAASSVVIMATNVPAWADCSPEELAQLNAADWSASDEFSSSIAISGETAIIGAPNDDHEGGINAGSAYVFVRVAGVWTQQAKLTASDAAGNDNFGLSVGLSGNTAVIGAFGDENGGGVYAGSAYVFVRNGGVWNEEAKLTASDAAFRDYFGISVAIFGETIVVGAYGDDHSGGADAGSAYVFVRSVGVWTEQSRLSAADAAADDEFGNAVAISSDRIVVGSENSDHAGLANAGAAYVFVRSESIWTQEAKLTASDAATLDLFGHSIAVTGDTAIVGVHNDDNAGGQDAGSAYVFIRSNNVWTQQAKLTATDPGVGEYFGMSVALWGELAIIGARNDSHSGVPVAGSAYVFLRSGSNWVQQAKLTTSDPMDNDQFGNSVAALGDTALVGARFGYQAGIQYVGSVYVFDLECGLDANGDADGDGVINAIDNCLYISNSLQEDSDADMVGDACDLDVDGDGVINSEDACPNNAPGLPTECTGRPLRDCNGDCYVDALDVQCIVDEIINQQ